MKKKIKQFMPCLLLILVICTFAAVSAGAEEQENLAEIFTENFRRGDSDVKYKVLKDAVDMDVRGIEPLFLTAVRYVIDNLHLLDKDPALLRIALLAVDRIHQLGYRDAAADLFTVFTGSQDTELNIGILIALGDIAADDADVIEKMNQWLASCNLRFLSGKTPDMQVVAACIRSLGRIGQPSSFLPVFTAMTIKYSLMITAAAEQALDAIKGDLSSLLMNVIREGRYADKNAALSMALKSAKLSVKQKCAVAMFCIEVGVNSSPVDMEQKNFSLEMRSTAVSFLGMMEWTDATELLIEHFNQTLFDMDKGRVDKTYLVSAITALGRMKSHEAAKRLAIYLEYMNSYTEKYKVYDEQIVLAVIYALRQLGDNTANAALLYVRYLNYSKTVREAADETLKLLK